MSDAPIINFSGISGSNVLASVLDMPAGAHIVFVSKTSGQTFGSDPVPGSGNGQVTLPLPSGMPSGDYYLEAKDSAGSFLAESVTFYIDAVR